MAERRPQQQRGIKQGKRTSSEANLEDEEEETKQLSEELSYVSRNTQEATLENVLCHAPSPLHEPNCTPSKITEVYNDFEFGELGQETLNARRQLFYFDAMDNKSSRPYFPGTQCQFGLYANRPSTQVIDIPKLEIDQSRNSSPCIQILNRLQSPESGIAFPSPHKSQSPSASFNFNVGNSSGIGSIQEMELGDNDVKYSQMDTTFPWFWFEQPENVDQLEIGELKLKKNRYSTRCKQMQKFLQRRFVFLKRELSPRSVADRLYNDLVIDERSLEAIHEAIGRRQKCDVLIKAISHSLNSSKEDTTQRIIEAFEKESCGYLLKDFDLYSLPVQDSQMDESDMVWDRKLDIFAAKMEDELDPRHFIDELVAEEVLEFDEHENIMNVQFKPEKIGCLIKYLKKKNRKTFEDFCTVIKKSYVNSNVVDELCNIQTFVEKDQKEPSVPPPVYIAKNEEQSYKRTPTATTTHIKFKFEGDAADIERMIVDENSPYPNENLQEEAMDVAAFEVQDTQFSSIRIVLSALSQRSEMQFIEKCKQSPVFLKKILQSLIKQNQLKQLKERNISRIMFEIKIEWPHSKITMQDISTNMNFLEKKMSKDDILRIIRKIKGSETAIEHINKAGSSAECFEHFITFLSSESSETAVDLFVEELNKEKRKDIVERLENTRIKRDKRTCCCQIRKETIVEHFTLMDERITNAAQIIEMFSKFPGFETDVQNEFGNILEKESAELRTDAFLRKLLELPDDGVQLCLLEEQLHTTGQSQLLEEITESKSNEQDIKMTEDDIRRNMSFLCDELEPNQYVYMLKDIDETESLCERLLAAASREDRCIVLLEYILDQCTPGDENQILFKFNRELRKIDPDVLRYIVDTRRKEIEELQSLKEGIIGSYKHIVEEIEPRSVLRIFKERQELSQEDIECVFSASTRRARAIKLMNCVLKGSQTKVRCLIDALRCVGYVSLLKKIQESTKTYKECPRLYHALQKTEYFKFNGELEIDFSGGAETPEDLQLYSSMSIFPKWSLVTNWVLENYFADKREEQSKDSKSMNNEIKKIAGTEQIYENEEVSSKQLPNNSDKTGKANSAYRRETENPNVNADLNERTSKQSDLTYTGLEKCRSHTRCGLDSHWKGFMEESQGQTLNPYRNDEIFDIYSDSRSPISGASHPVSGNLSDEDESCKPMEEIPTAETALIMFADGLVM